MFWKSNKTNRPKGINNIDPIFIAPPMIKYFQTAHQILKNAMVFNDKGEYDICNETLQVLKKHIDKYCSEGDVKMDKPNQTVSRGNTSPPPSPKKNDEPKKLDDVNVNDVEVRDISTAKLTKNVVTFMTAINPFFYNKYKGIIKTRFIKHERLVFETKQDAENYFFLETIKLKDESK